MIYICQFSLVMEDQLGIRDSKWNRRAETIVIEIVASPNPAKIEHFGRVCFFLFRFKTITIRIANIIIIITTIVIRVPYNQLKEAG